MKCGDGLVDLMMSETAAGAGRQAQGGPARQKHRRTGLNELLPLSSAVRAGERETHRSVEVAEGDTSSSVRGAGARPDLGELHGVGDSLREWPPPLLVLPSSPSVNSATFETIQVLSHQHRSRGRAKRYKKKKGIKFCHEKAHFMLIIMNVVLK